MAETDSEAPENGSFLAAGVVLGILASMSGTAGKQCLRFSELQRRKGTPAAVCVGKVSLALGLALNVIVGPLVDMASYAFAPQSVIAPLGGLDVVWNTLTAPFTLGETLTPRLFFGCIVITGGAIATSLTGSHDSGNFTPETVEKILIRPAVLIYLLALAAWLLFNVLVLMPRSAAPKGQPWQSGDRLRGLSLGMTAGSIAGNMFCVKAFVEVVQDSIKRERWEAWMDWLPYGLFGGALFFAFSNLYFLTKAMREYEALFMGAVFEGSLIISACISGVVVFSELESLQTWQIALYWAAILLITGGIYVVSTGSNPPPVATPQSPKGITGPQGAQTAALSHGKDGFDLAGIVPATEPEDVPGASLKELEMQQFPVPAEKGQQPAPVEMVNSAAAVAAAAAKECALRDGHDVEEGNLFTPVRVGCPHESGARPGQAGVRTAPIGGSCQCADGITCFCGMQLLRSKLHRGQPGLVRCRL